MNGLRRRWRSVERLEYVFYAVGAAGIVGAVVLVIVLPSAALKVIGAVVGLATSAVARWVVSGIKNERALDSYRRRVERDPLSLFPNRPHVDQAALGSRDAQVEAVVGELDAQRTRDDTWNPILVMGDAGSGKTTFAAALAQRLAKSGRVPVVPVIVTLARRGDKILFDDLGHERFAKYVENNELSGDAAALWKYARKARRCVVIADGLDERVTDSRAPRVTQATELILGADAATSLPLVVTSRPDGFDERRRLRAATWLEELPERYVAQWLARDSKGRLDESRAREITRRLGLTERPLYFTVARDLARSHAGQDLLSLADIGDTDLARCGLLDRRLESYIEDSPGDRRRAVDAAAVLALVALRNGKTMESLDERDDEAEAWLNWVAGAPLDRRDAVAPLNGRDADGLTFVQVTDEGVRFRHPIIQTYLAARALDLVPGTDTRPWARLLEKGSSDEVGRALRMYAMRAVLHSDQASVEENIAAMVRDLETRAQVPALSSSQRLGVLATAAHAIGSVAGEYPHALEVERDDLARLIADTWDVSCSLPVKAEAIAHLSRMSGRVAFESAWQIALDDDSYHLRWEVVEAMAESAAAADALRDKVAPLVKECAAWARNESAPDSELRESRVRELSIVAKFLPSGNEGLGTEGGGHASDTAAALTRELGDAVAAIAPRRRGLGVEASLAQGLKHAARRYPLSDANCELAERLAAGGVFWYARIMALHALVRHAIAIADTGTTGLPLAGALDSAEVQMEAAKRDKHAWVREAAEQGSDALASLRADDRDQARSYIWHDEAQIARASQELSKRSARLLADVAIVLNMNEQGDHAVVANGGEPVPHEADEALVEGCKKCKHQLEVGTSSELPDCLSKHADRRRVLDGRCTCSFELCPYDFAAYQKVPHAHRGQLSPGFCARQRTIAKSLGPPPWQRDVELAAYIDFWERMETRAGEEAVESSRPVNSA